MKIALTFITLIFVNLYADKNWITITPMNEPNNSKKNTHVDVNLSQIAPINKMMKNATIFKQLFDATNKKEKVIPKDDKNWFVLKSKVF